MSALALSAAASAPSLRQSISSVLARLRALRPALELRIDVQPSAESIEAELEALYRRLSTPGASPRGLSLLPPRLPGFAFRHREADGEHYVYVEDVLRRRLAGYTVFNRLVEVDRRIDPYVRGPHSKYAPAYQRRGLATAVYEWGLEQGFFLVSGARQSAGAHALWRALGRRYLLGYVALRDRQLRFLGTEIPREAREHLDTRMILWPRSSRALPWVQPSSAPRRTPSPRRR